LAFRVNEEVTKRPGFTMQFLTRQIRRRRSLERR
jgi:hypothetical protein